MHQFVQPGERVFVILTSGGLSISQSVVTLLRADFDAGRGLAQASSLYDAARIVGDCVRRVSDIDRSSLERDSFSFNVHLLLGGQVRGQEPNLYLIYPREIPWRPPKIPCTCNWENASMAGRSWTGEFRPAPRWKSRQNTPCFRWTPL